MCRSGNSLFIGVVLGITSFGVEIHPQNSGIHSQSDSNHTTLEWIPLQNEVIHNMTPKSVDFHSTVLRE